MREIGHAAQINTDNGMKAMLPTYFVEEEQFILIKIQEWPKMKAVASPL